MLGRYRHWPINIATAAVIAMLTASFATADFTEGQRTHSAVTIATPFLATVGAVGVVRSLRRTLTITTVGVERRGLLWGWALPWSVISDASVTAHGWATSIRVVNGPHTHRAYVRDIDSTLIHDVTAGRLACSPTVADGAWRAQKQRQTRGVVLLVLLGATSGACVSLQTGLSDTDRYDARNARDVAANAAVVDWRVHKVHDHDDEDHDRTDATIRFRTVTGDEITTVIKRWGSYARPETLRIVYDPVNPTDADFADRPNRAAQNSSAAARRRLGAAGAVAGIAAIVAMILYSRLARLGDDGAPVSAASLPPPPPRSRSRFWPAPESPQDRPQPVRRWAFDAVVFTTAAGLVLAVVLAGLTFVVSIADNAPLVTTPGTAAAGTTTAATTPDATTDRAKRTSATRAVPPSAAPVVLTSHSGWPLEGRYHMQARVTDCDLDSCGAAVTEIIASLSSTSDAITMTSPYGVVDLTFDGTTWSSGPLPIEGALQLVCGGAGMTTTGQLAITGVGPDGASFTGIFSLHAAPSASCRASSVTYGLEATWITN